SLPPTVVETPPPPKAVTKKKKSTAAPIGAPVGEKEYDASIFIDKNRDLFVPIAMLSVGTLLHVLYPMIHYNLSIAAVTPIAVGVLIMAMIEAVLLIGIAFVVAGPLGLGFGDPRTAAGKFMAIVMLSDGASEWVNGLMHKLAGGTFPLLFGFSAGLIATVVVCWVSFCYLFSLDASEAKIAMFVLGFCERVLAVIVIFLVLPTVLGWGGVQRSAMDLPSFGHAQAPPNPMVDAVEDEKAHGLLIEARQYAHQTGRSAELPHINEWYAAGAPNVYYEVSRDINWHATPHQIVVELPKDPAGRAKCYDIARKWYSDFQMGFMVELLHDKGEPFLMVALPM
ncbi:MAG TPA: hypothetical protein VL992_07215, partial [Tepidisphaeraceae bacterium]|nr:hypothetical protein [Tepidisphaeraceae bacterium]